MDKKKLEYLIAESNPEFFDAVKLKDHHKSEIIIIDGAKHEPKIITVNGVNYTRRVREEKLPRKEMSPVMAMMVSMSAYGQTSAYKRPRPVVDIAEEFGRIQRKESKLSRNDRQWVENQFNYEYEPIKDK